MIQTAIREAMGRQNVSLSRLARDAHVQRATIYSWFTGSRPEPDTWGRVAARLELPELDDLLHQHTPSPTDVVAAIHENTAMLKLMLDEELIQETERLAADAQRALDQEQAGRGSPRRKPARIDRASEPRRKSTSGGAR